MSYNRNVNIHMSPNSIKYANLNAYITCADRSRRAVVLGDKLAVSEHITVTTGITLRPKILIYL